MLIPVFVVLLVSDIPYGAFLAIAVFSIAAFTDKLDGYIARSRGQITTLGQFLDPLADKLLISAALIALVGLGKLPAWVAMVIIAREFAVTALRVVGIDQGVSIPAGTLGKAKTTSQIVCIIILMWPHGHLSWAPYVEVPAVAIMVALTLISGAAVLHQGARQPAPAGGRQMTQATAAVLLTGSELLDGRTRDRNGHYLGGTLSRRGFRVSHIVLSPDDAGALRRDLAALLAEAPAVLVVSGGLGTTHDDLTAATVAAVTGRELATDPAALRMVTDSTRRVAARRGLPADELLPQMSRQALLPRGARAIAPAGVAPGFVLRHGATSIVALPGVPWEVQAMWPAVLDDARRRGRRRAAAHAVGAALRLGRGAGRGPAARRGHRPPAGGDHRLHRRGHGDDRSSGRRPRGHGPGRRARRGAGGRPRVLERRAHRRPARGRPAALARRHRGDRRVVHRRPARRPPHRAAGQLRLRARRRRDLRRRRQARPAGRAGRAAARRTARCPKPVARAMAEGARARLGATYALSTTGVAGPGGGSPGKPVGLVFIACAAPDGTVVRRHEFPGDRDTVRAWSVVAALHLLRRAVAS